MLCHPLTVGLTVLLINQVYAIRTRELESQSHSLYFHNGQLFVGGTDYIYKLSDELELIKIVSTSRVSENTQANQVKSITAFASDKFIACGTYYGGCEVYDYESVTRQRSFISPQYMVSTETNDTMHILVAQYVPVPSESSPAEMSLWIATSHDSTRISSQQYAVSLRSSQDGELLTNQQGSIFGQYQYSAALYDKDVGGLLSEYVYAFVEGEFRYFIRRTNTGSSSIASVCSNDRLFATYVEINIGCQVQDTTLTVIQAADYNELVSVGQDGRSHSEKVLFAVFGSTKASDDTAMCVFPIDILVQRMQSAYSKCYVQNPDSSLRNVSVSLAPPDLDIRNGVNCAPAFSAMSDASPRCKSIERLFGDDYNTPIYRSAVLTQSSTYTISRAVNSLKVLADLKRTIAFSSSLDGMVLKMQFPEGLYQIVDVTRGTAGFKPLIEIGSSNIYLIGDDKKVYGVPLANCGQATTCDGCVELADPLCGWCALEQRCARDVDCPNYEYLGHWITSSNNSCPALDVKGQLSVESVEDIPESFSLKVKLNSRPQALGGELYSCCYVSDDKFTHCVELSGDVVIPQVGYRFTCVTPNLQQLRNHIPIGQDHVNVTLQVRLGNSMFVSASQIYYDCSRHTGCVTCTESLFYCKWCLSGHKCTKASEEKCEPNEEIVTAIDQRHSDRAGSQYCPRIEPVNGAGSQLYVPSGRIAEVVAKVQHVLTPTSELVCYFKWEDASVQYPVIAMKEQNQESNDIIRCDVTQNFTYTSASPQQVAQFSVCKKAEGTPMKCVDNPSSMKVIIYKCEQMATECGACLTELEQKFSCGWCRATSSTCTYKDDCSVASGYAFLDQDDSCPDLEISSIKPTSGPVDGGTLLTIKGENLGKKFSDIVQRVAIVGEINGREISVMCNPVEDLSSVPKLIVCRTARLRDYTEADSFQGRVTIEVDTSTDLIATSTEKFSFQSPKFENISPRRGPVSGGTEVVLHGDYLTIGSNVQVTVRTGAGSVPCTITSESPHLKCKTPPSTTAENAYFSIAIDDHNVELHQRAFKYVDDSTIHNVLPQAGITSGGTEVSVTGTNLDIVAKPQIYLKRVERKKRSLRQRIRRQTTGAGEYYGACKTRNSTYMTCRLPSFNASNELTETVTADRPISFSYGFIMDDILSVRNISQYSNFTDFQVFPDPVFVNFGEHVYSPNGTNQVLTIEGKNLLLIGKSDVVISQISVKLDKDLACNVTVVLDKLVACNLPEIETGAKYAVTVKYGENVYAQVGAVVNRSGFPIWAIAAIAGSFAVLIIIVIIIISVCQAKVHRSGKNMKKLQNQMDSLEIRVAKECKEAFTELQTDMTEMTSDVQGLHGLPFYEYQSYCMKILFPNHEDFKHPVVNKLEICDRRDSVEKGLHHFGRLLHNKTFILTFIRTLEQQREFRMTHRVDVASLLSVALQNKMEYQTDILKTLLAELIEKSVDRNPKILLRRTESVAEKMLSNWFTFLLHKFLKLKVILSCLPVTKEECAGEPLYLLYRAIKQQIDKGPVDAVTSDAKYSLSEDKLLRQSVDFKPLTLQFQSSPDPHASQGLQSVKVLDCDTISQAIDKILDTLYRNVRYSNNAYLKDTLQLEWVKENGERVVMRDEDPLHSKQEGDNRPLVTLARYKIPDGALVMLTLKNQYPSLENSGSRSRFERQSLSTRIYDYMLSSLPRNDSISSLTTDTSSNGLFRNGSSSGLNLVHASSSNNILDTSFAKEKKTNLYHLVKPQDQEAHHDGERNKMVSEIYLTRLLATKGTLQQFVDDLFETIFSTTHRGSALPLAIKYMFDFLDDQALLHDIRDSEVIHNWKSNSLPLRFWVNVIKNPDFVFDIHKSNIVDACLSVVAQIFMDSCSQGEHRLGKDSPSSKLLYAKDMSKYKKWVERYYQDIKSMPAISDQDMNTILMEESRQHSNEFNSSAALFELYQYVLQYKDEITSALEEDEFARKHNLAQNLDYVNSLLNMKTRL